MLPILRALSVTHVVPTDVS